MLEWLPFREIEIRLKIRSINSDVILDVILDVISDVIPDVIIDFSFM